MSESDKKDMQNLKTALQKKEVSIHSYTEQIKAFDDPQINALLEGILRNEIQRKLELEEQIERMSA
jgi:rubrerythrin